MLHKLFKSFFHLIFAPADRRVASYIRVICFCKKHNYYMLGLIVIRRLQRKYGVYMTYKTQFDQTLILPHPVGVVLGDGAKIGKNTIIFQNVTLGRSDANVAAYPKVGSNTIIYSGAVVLGGISIGNNCIIGANAVVTKSIPDNCIAIGVPARIIQRDCKTLCVNHLS